MRGDLHKPVPGVTPMDDLDRSESGVHVRDNLDFKVASL